jgi:hypothetical protein
MLSLAEAAFVWCVMAMPFDLRSHFLWPPSSSASAIRRKRPEPGFGTEAAMNWLDENPRGAIAM